MADVYLTFESDEDREIVTAQLRSFTLPGRESMEQDAQDVMLRLPDADDDQAAVARAGRLVEGACRGTGIDPAAVGVHLALWSD
ncbi:hypothetical protein FSW04_18055 [Baekduia soli]|uniref:Uncharacterized protein n=1 Tax=Baekduia soli TaxID=496014 RepID=A0A5B8U898_9ACTN|nr:hypothetical protein [Baekduia soli]QEC49294.1 hypothetical protein FSW04_18055 [Baekduia soli]